MSFYLCHSSLPKASGELRVCAFVSHSGPPGEVFALWRSYVAPLAPFSALGGPFGLRPGRSYAAFWLSVANFGVVSRRFAHVGRLWWHVCLLLAAQTHEIHGFTQGKRTTPKNHIFHVFLSQGAQNRAKKRPKTTKKPPKAAQRSPKTSQREPKGPPKPPKGTPKAPQRSPK